MTHKQFPGLPDLTQPHPKVRRWNKVLQFFRECRDPIQAQEALAYITPLVATWPGWMRIFEGFQPDHPCWPLAGALRLHPHQIAEAPANAHHAAHIERLELRRCSDLKDLSLISFFPQLTGLKVLRSEGIERVNGIACAKNLRTLLIDGCDQLGEIEELGQLILLEDVDLTRSGGITSVEVLHPCKELVNLDLGFGLSLKNLDGIAAMPRLEILYLGWCNALTDLDGLADLPALTQLSARQAIGLRSLDGIEQVPSLELLELYGCVSLQDVRALAHLPKLANLDLRECDALHQEPTHDSMHTRALVAAFQEKLAG